MRARWFATTIGERREDCGQNNINKTGQNKQRTKSFLIKRTWHDSKIEQFMPFSGWKNVDKNRPKTIKLSAMLTTSREFFQNKIVISSKMSSLFFIFLKHCKHHYQQGCSRKSLIQIIILKYARSHFESFLLVIFSLARHHDIIKTSPSFSLFNLLRYTFSYFLSLSGS
jgi:hypothetical protein